jgi:hypothetical protein
LKIEDFRLKITAVLTLLLATVVIAQSQAPGALAPPKPIPGGQPTGRGNVLPATGTGRISGRVIAADTGAPIVRAQVRVLLTGAREERVFATDEQGRYTIDELPAGRYRATASKPGYLTMSYGQRRAVDPGRPVDVNDDRTSEGVDFTLLKAGVIVATITDEHGELARGFRVNLHQYRYRDGIRQLSSVPLALGSPFAGETNDLGQVRLHGLPPGDYYVSATMGTDVMTTRREETVRMTYGETYYPGTVRPTEALNISVAPGQEASVSFSLVPQRFARISGVVLSGTGSPIRQADLRLASRVMSRAIQIAADGSFTLPNVPPDDYLLAAAPSAVQKTGAGECVSVPLTVTGADVTGLVLTTAKCGTLRGRFAFEGSESDGLRPGSLQIASPIPFAPSFPFGGLVRASSADWSFEMAGLWGPRVFRPRTPLPSGWFMKGLMLDGKDVTDTPIDFTGGKDVEGLEVILTRQRTEVTGAVTDIRGAAASDYAVVLFAEDRDLWTPQSRFVAAGRPDQQGRFSVVGLPPGRYLAAAVDFIETGEEFDPALLNLLQSSATRITLADGETRTVSLRLRER